MGSTFSLMMIRHGKRIFSISLVLILTLCLSLSLLASPALAAVNSYNAADYVSDTVVDGNTKTVTYSFTDGELAITTIAVDNVSQGTAKGAFSYSVPYANVYKVSLTTFFMGVVNFVNRPPTGGIIDVSDIMPGASLAISARYKILHQAYDSTDNRPLDLRYRSVAYCYDANYNFVSSVTSSWSNAETTKETIDIVSDITLPGNVVYICPSIQVIWEYSDSIDNYLFTVVPQGFSFSCDVNMIYEQSQSMQKIHQQLGDLGGKLDNTNDKLDEIISGGDAGEALGPAGDAMTGASGEMADQAGNLGSGMDDITDFESDMMGQLDSAFGDLDITSGVVLFAPAFDFISGFLEEIYAGLFPFEVALTMPLFIGLFFGLCQHVGGVTHMRARHAAEARNSELHEARLTRIRSGGRS